MDTQTDQKQHLVMNNNKVLPDSQVNPENSNNSQDNTQTTVTYAFTSYLDSGKTNQWGTGTVQTTGVTDGNYIQVEVLTNVPEDSNNPFIGKKVFVNANSTDNNRTYRLYASESNNTKGEAIDIWVEISE